MFIELNPDGSVLNTYDDTDPARQGEQYPDDTVIRQETLEGRRRVTGVLRIARTQPSGWDNRAARQYNPVTNRWEDTGGVKTMNPLELAFRRLRQPIGPTPTIDDLSDIQAAINALYARQRIHRFILLKLMRFLYRRIARDSDNE